MAREPGVFIRVQPRRFLEGLPVALAGIAWLVLAWRAGAMLGVLGSVPGALLIASGLAQWLWPGDRQIGYHMALSAGLSVPLALAMMPWLGAVPGGCLAIAGAFAFLLAGRSLWLQHAMPAAVARPHDGPALYGKIATDAALLGAFVNIGQVPRGAAVDDDLAALEDWRALAARGAWAHDPSRMHGPVGMPDASRIEPVRHARRSYEWWTAPTTYAPPDAWPGSRRWRAHEANRRMAARLIRHDDGAPRPWLICVHGYRMGLAALDFQLFDVERLHHRLGLNLLMPILPLHGVRRATRLTGGLFLDGPLADLVHGQAQTLCELRSYVAWIRSVDPEAPIGVLGYSLGGYHAALLAGFEPALACAIAAIPLTDIATTLWQHLPLAHARYLEARGLTAAALADVLRPVSPLGVAPRIDRDRRFILAAKADQLIAPSQPRALWQHWDEPAMAWYDGSHLSVRQESVANRFVADALVGSGLGAD